MKTYVITPHDGSPAYEIDADSYEFVETTGRHIFREKLR